MAGVRRLLLVVFLLVAFTYGRRLLSLDVRDWDQAVVRLAATPSSNDPHEIPLSGSSRHELENDETSKTNDDFKPEFYDEDAPLNPLEELHHALETMQTHFFQLWLGTWPSAIDWTAAVMGTHLSASLYSLTRSLEYVLPGTLSSAASDEAERVENEINKYFSQSVAYYFGENAFAIRTQAYDDMLWVVLGWLESIKFIHLHNSKHYPTTKDSVGEGAWYGTQFEPQFAHRARIFYDLAAKGWDTTLCGGGMIWSPHLGPYKNAITNELYISASIGMYLYFPGDDNTAPFSKGSTDYKEQEKAEPHDLKHLRAAIEGYAWLKSSSMTNDQGLYVDGFHIRGYGQNGSIGTGKCDVRNEMVYTYNQGVILSGLRGLWEGTGQQAYLEDGHELIRNVIAATGWEDGRPSGSWRWSGLGRNGVLEEVCDSSGTCSQNGQTFKGIFFQHLTAFCEPLPRHPLIPGKTHAANPILAHLHLQSCKEYTPWVIHNARAAIKTRDKTGEFGMWWGRPAADPRDTPEAAPLPDGATDYRNEGQAPTSWGVEADENAFDQSLLGTLVDDEVTANKDGELVNKDSTRGEHTNDLNGRGRGRTVETQGGGVAVLRAAWELVSMYNSR